GLSLPSFRCCFHRFAGRAEILFQRGGGRIVHVRFEGDGVIFALLPRRLARFGRRQGALLAGGGLGDGCRLVEIGELAHQFLFEMYGEVGLRDGLRRRLLRDRLARVETHDPGEFREWIFVCNIVAVGDLELVSLCHYRSRTRTRPRASDVAKGWLFTSLMWAKGGRSFSRAERISVGASAPISVRPDVRTSETACISPGLG